MKVPVEDLLKGMIVQSGNDATVALAEVWLAVERFVQLMNQQAAATWAWLAPAIASRRV